MDKELISKAIIASLSIVLGFTLKTVWDYFLKRKYERNEAGHKKSMEFLERQLSEFYWPLLFYIKKNTFVFNKLMDKTDQKDPLNIALMDSMSKNFFFPNNEKMMEVIEKKYYLAQAPEKLNSLIQDFIKHQSIFQGIKETFEKNHDPVRFGEPWPIELLETVESYTLQLQQEYDIEIGRIKKKD